VNTELTVFDQLEDFFGAHLAGIVDFQRATRNVSAVENGKHRGFKKSLISPIEGAVDKYAFVIARCGGPI